MEKHCYLISVELNNHAEGGRINKTTPWKGTMAEFYSYWVERHGDPCILWSTEISNDEYESTYDLFQCKPCEDK